MLRRWLRRSLERHTANLTLEGLPFTPGQIGTTIRPEPSSITVLVPGSSESHSKMVSVLAGLEATRSGRVLVGGVDVASSDIAAARRLVGLVMSDPFLIEGTVADNILFGMCGVRPRDLVSAARISGVVDASDDPNERLNSAVASEGTNLSVGLRRRVALARTLLRNPPVVVADEPTLGLTDDDLDRTRTALSAVGKSRALVVVSTSDDLAELADRIVSFSPPQSASMPSSQPGDAGLVSLSQCANHITNRPIPTINAERAAAHRPATGHVAILRGKKRGLGTTPSAGLAPGYIPASIHSRTELTDTWLAWSTDHNQMVKVEVARHRPVLDQARRAMTVHYLRANTFAHPALSEALDVDIHGPHPYAAFSYFCGTPLDRQFSRRLRSSDTKRLLTIGCQLADALSHIHHTGYALVSLRPEIVTERNGQAFIDDLTSAVPLNSMATAPSAPGIRQFTAPECLAEEPISAKADVYSLGMLLRAGLSRSGDTSGVDRPAGPNSAHDGRDLPAALHTFLGQMTAASPEDRPDTAEALAAMTTLAGMPPRTPSVPQPEPVSSFAFSE